MRREIILSGLIFIIIIGLIPTIEIYNYFIFEHEIKLNISYLIVFSGISLPFLLIIATFFVLFSEWRLSRLAAWLLAIVVLFGFLCWVLAAAAFAPPAAPLISIRALALTMAALALLRFLARAQTPSLSSRFAWTMLGIAVAIALWSLAGMVWVSYKASAIANGRPYCLAVHASESKTVRSFAELRYFSFYTTASGPKSSSHWYFHGVLIVDAKDGRKVYNWSPRRFAWDRVEQPDILLENPIDACNPKSRFLGELRIY